MSSARSPVRSVAWFALLLAGQGATLALIRAGRVVGYQHFELDALLATGLRRAAVALLLIQTAAVAFALRHSWLPIARAVRMRLGTVGSIVALLALFGVSAAPSLAPERYAAELLLAFFTQIVALATVVCFARSVPETLLSRWQRCTDRWLGSKEQRDVVPGSWSDRTALVAAGAAVIVAAFLAACVYERIPHLPDEIVYLLQAKYFAAGQLALPPPGVPAAFDIDLMYLDEGRWFSPVPPGWPALLALGAAAGVAWLVNPLLTGVAVLLTHMFLRELYPPRQARAATVLLAASPWLLFLGMSLMTHVATLAFALLAALGVTRARRLGAAWPAFAAGLAVGVVSLIRPLEGLVLALLLGAWSLGARGRRWRLAPSVALTLGAVLAGSLIRPYNAALTGSASRFPLMLYSDKYYAPGSNDVGFGANRGLGWALDPFPGHGIPDVVVNSILNTYAINIELFGWAAGSLCVAAALLAMGKLARADSWMLLAALAVVAAHAFYWFSGGPDFGGRYWFLVIVPLCALTASGLQRAAANGGDDTRARFSLGAAALTAAALLTFVPWRAADKYRHFRRMEPGIARLVTAHNIAGALVLVRGLRHPDYHGAAIFNPLDLDALSPRSATRALFAWDRSRAVREAVVSHYPGRPVWIVDGPTVTGAGYAVRAGPLPPGSLVPDVESSDEAEIPMKRERRRPTG